MQPFQLRISRVENQVHVQCCKRQTANGVPASKPCIFSFRLLSPVFHALLQTRFRTSRPADRLTPREEQFQHHDNTSIFVMAKATIELGGLVDEIRTVVSEACRDSIDSRAKNSTPVMPAMDIAGMRETILGGYHVVLDIFQLRALLTPDIGNARSLWTIVNPGRAKDIPTFDLIVFCKGATVRAMVVWRNLHDQLVVFMGGPSRDSAASATEGLLLTTMTAIGQKLDHKVYRDESLQWAAACMPNATGAGWYEE